jgi:pSer/pThr/pTyr-binding forkhead associated (FHA) protein
MQAIKVILMSGPDDGLEVWLRDEENKGSALEDGWQFSVGRHEGNDLVIPFDTHVSRNHAIIVLKGDGLLLGDLDSHNGTYVQDRRVEDVSRIETGQLLRIGQTWLTVAEVDV